MKFFTPQIYVQGQSTDPDLVDWVEAEWERNLKRYRRHYKKIESELPTSVRAFHDQECLHDALVLGPAELSLRTFPWNGHDIVIVAQKERRSGHSGPPEIVFLQFGVTAPPVVEVPVEAPCFATRHPLWLYEEFDALGPGRYQIEIFLSDGRVVRLEFQDFHWFVANPVIVQGQNGGVSGQERMASVG